MVFDWLRKLLKPERAEEEPILKGDGETTCPCCGSELWRMEDHLSKRRVKPILLYCRNCGLYTYQMICRAGYGGGLKTFAMEQKDMCIGDCETCPYTH